MSDCKRGIREDIEAYGYCPFGYVCILAVVGLVGPILVDANHWKPCKATKKDQRV